MKIELIIRPGKKCGHVTMRTDFRRESLDTPRITNFGIEIRQKLDEIIRESTALNTSEKI